MINVAVSKENNISHFTYNFVFGANGQDAIEVRTDPANFDYQSRLDYCAVAVAGTFGPTSPQTP